MSIETLIKEHIQSNADVTQAVRDLIAELQGNSAGNTSDKNSTTKQPSVDSSAESKGKTGRIAKVKTYIFFKDNKSGCIIEKGKAIPEDNGATPCKKSNWEKLCEKYSLDVATGNPIKTTNGDDDDLDLDLDEAGITGGGGDDDLDLDLEEAGSTGGDDDLDLDDEDDGLGLDEEPSISRDDVKAALVKVMKSRGRETSLAVMKKYGASNLEEIKESDFEAIIATATKVANKKKG